MNGHTEKLSPVNNDYNTAGMDDYGCFLALTYQLRILLRITNYFRVDGFKSNNYKEYPGKATKI